MTETASNGAYDPNAGNPESTGAQQQPETTPAAQNPPPSVEPTATGEVGGGQDGETVGQPADAAEETRAAQEPTQNPGLTGADDTGDAEQ